MRCARGPNRAALAQRLAEKWTVGLIDESQDTDQQQLDIFRAIFDRGRGTGTAHPGGRSEAGHLQFSRRGTSTRTSRPRPTDDARISSLATTYRSAPSLVTALNALFGRPHAFATPDLSYPAATAARRDEDLPLPDDGHGRLVAWGDPPMSTPRIGLVPSRVACARLPALPRPSWIYWTGRWDPARHGSIRHTWPC